MRRDRGGRGAKLFHVATAEMFNNDRADRIELRLIRIVGDVQRHKSDDASLCFVQIIMQRVFDLRRQLQLFAAVPEGLFRSQHGGGKRLQFARRVGASIDFVDAAGCE